MINKDLNINPVLIKNTKVLTTGEVGKILGVTVNVERLIQLGFNPVCGRTNPRTLATYWDVNDIEKIAIVLAHDFIKRSVAFKLNNENAVVLEQNQ